MPRFLYITPYFPPNNRVGALRPLKFCRHIRASGWEPVVFCDLKPGDSTDRALLDHVPDDLIVHRTYSKRAGRTWAAYEEGLMHDKRQRISAPARNRNRFWNNPELIPYGEHLADIPAAIREGRHLLRRYRCEAILVNIDPHAAARVGYTLARESGLPLILDFRDPWSVCELRRPMRPAPIRRLVDRMERRIVEASSRVILNTDTALGHYRSHYADLDPELFTCIRNFGERELINNGTVDSFPFRSMLFMGNLRRFIDGFEMVDVLAELKRRGIGGDRFRLVISGQVLAETMERAVNQGVADMIHTIHPVPYTRTFPLMMAADLLLLIAHDTSQRIPAKFYDYAVSGKPILAMSENPELNVLLETCNGRAFPFDGIVAMADHIMSVLEDPAMATEVGKQKAPIGDGWSRLLTAEESSAKLARFLGTITEP